MSRNAFIFSLLFCFLPISAHAQTPNCESLDEAAKNVAEHLLSQTKGYDCCTDTIASCLKANPTCKRSEFIAKEICRLAAKGTKESEIKTLIEQRSKTMSPDAKVFSIEIKPEHIWGNPESKTILSVYLCGRCPYCSRHVPQLIKLLEQASLKDKVAVNLKYFPIKSHDNSTPAALAIEAAAQMGQAWPYLTKSYENFDAFSLKQINVWSNEIGLDQEKFNAFMKDPAIRKNVADSKKEGLINGVTTTPTFFLNGRRIEGKFDAESIISMIQEDLAATSSNLSENSESESENHN